MPYEMFKDKTFVVVISYPNENLPVIKTDNFDTAIEWAEALNEDRQEDQDWFWYGVEAV